MSGVFGSVYIPRPINRSAARGIASGAIVSSWGVEKKRMDDVKSPRTVTSKMRRVVKSPVRCVAYKDEMVFGRSKGQVLRLMGMERQFLRDSGINRSDKTYKLAIQMKLKGMRAVELSMRPAGKLWTLEYKTKDGVIRPVSSLSAELHCSLVSIGNRENIEEKLDELNAIMDNYDCIGWTVD